MDLKCNGTINGNMTVVGLYIGELSQYRVPVYGYLSPVLIIFTVITNILVSVILLKPHMRSPTNTMLVAMALSDMFTGIFPLPYFIYAYSFENYRECISFEHCWMFKYLYEVIPTVFHTASIWLTVALAVQRYIYVCHNLAAKKWCTISSSIKTTVVIYVLSILSQLSRCFDTDMHSVEVQSELRPNETVTSCDERLNPWFDANKDVYYNIYYWFRVIFIHLIPCTSLIILNALLVSALQSARRRRKRLMQQKKTSESKKLQDSNHTTLMLIAVVGLFLIVEFPLGVSFVLYIIQNTIEITIITDRTLNIMNLIINFFILLSYPLNFFIYCAMSRQFRETFKALLKGKGRSDRDYNNSRYTTLAAKDDGVTQTTTTTKV